ncbi:hypothetical protein MPSEU_001003200 [Mayamaea pseudoterrestris]|nr:hypothetical protein MPSEU_001003200 [Mayamaea pseudoterrestris]
MSEDHDFFATPSADSTDEAPIILGEAPPPHDAFGGEQTDFASPPSSDGYLGDLNETGSGMESDNNAPIYLGASGDTDDFMQQPDQQFASGSADEGDNAGAIVDSGPSPMAKWNAEWQVLLQQRKDEENARKAELQAAADEALKQMLEEREQKKEARMAKNREDEQIKLEAIEADLENDNSWQRICKMVELSHDSSQKTADVKRMRDILIGLKNDTSKAVDLSA